MKRRESSWFCHLWFLLDNGRPIYILLNILYMFINSTGLGIASQLLENLIRYAKEQGYRTIVAGIDASNMDSIALHKKFDFSHAGTIKNVGYKFDRWLDLSFYQYDLSDS